MKKYVIIKRGLLKKALNILGVCSAGLIVSCAKYGSMVSTIYMDIKGTVKSQDSTKVIEGIQVGLRNVSNIDALSDTNGVFLISSEIDEIENTVFLKISDIDGDLNGNFLSKDTILNLSSAEKEAHIKKDIDIRLERNE